MDCADIEVISRLFHTSAQCLSFVNTYLYQTLSIWAAAHKPVHTKSINQFMQKMNTSMKHLLCLYA